MNLVLNSAELRVLGALIEKQMTVPEYYPLSLNALTAACNQKNNRAPLVLYSDKDVVRALDSLRDKHLAYSVDTAGSRVPKYSHNFTKAFPLSNLQTAILCELMLRGPQTVGELRTRNERFGETHTLPEVESALESLSTSPEGSFVVKLPREPGCRECRYTQLFSGPVNLTPEASQPTPEPATLEVRAENERLTSLETEVESLHKEMEALREQFSQFKRQFE